jgi:hypothetical protein
MAKKKSKEAPPRPPQSVSEAMLHEAYTRITEQHRADFCSALFAPTPSKSQKQRKRETESVLDFAALGWAYFMWRESQEEPS